MRHPTHVDIHMCQPARPIAEVRCSQTTGVDKEGQGAQPPNGRATKKGRGYLYQMSNITYLIEIRKFCSKNLVHKGVNFQAQNALRLTYKHL